jgi:hypothetical protein
VRSSPRLDISIVITGLPKIQESLTFLPTGLFWVQNAYTLALLTTNRLREEIFKAPPDLE